MKNKTFLNGPQAATLDVTNILDNLSLGFVYKFKSE